MTRAKRIRPEKVKEVKTKITWKEMKKQKELILLSLPYVFYVLLFSYVPLIGWIMAFQKYKPAKGFLSRSL